MTDAMLIPRFVQAYDAVAHKAGLTVSNTVTQSASCRDELTSIWRGSRKQMLATGLFGAAFRFPFAGHCNTFHNARIHGRMHSERGSVWAEIWWNVVPSQIENEDAVEVISYSDTTAYHGTFDALVSQGICTADQLPTGERTAKSLRRLGDQQYWQSRRLVDGTFIYKIQTADASAKAATARANADYQARIESLSPEQLAVARAYDAASEPAKARARALIRQGLRAQEKAKAAQNDSKFQRFMSRVLPGT